MIPCLPCEAVREQLEAFLDRELATGDQVAVETHLRSCRTCSAHLDDLSLIGWSLRAGTPTTDLLDGDRQALAAVQSGVLTRIRAERAQSLRARVPELFSDMHMWWPALGATCALLICICGSVYIWSTAMQRQPDSLAAMIESFSNPGSDENPMPLADAMSVPRVLDAGFDPDRIPAEDAEYAVSAIVTQNGTVGGVELLGGRRSVGGSMPALQSRDGLAVLAQLRGSRFTPAQSADGRRVAVYAVMLIVQTTIKLDVPIVRPASPFIRPAARPALPVPDDETPIAPAEPAPTGANTVAAEPSTLA